MKYIHLMARERKKISSIKERLIEVEEKIRIGDWETDTIASKDNAPGLSSLLVESRFLYFK